MMPKVQNACTDSVRVAPIHILQISRLFEVGFLHWLHRDREPHGNVGSPVPSEPVNQLAITFIVLGQSMASSNGKKGLCDVWYSSRLPEILSH